LTGVPWGDWERCEPCHLDLSREVMVEEPIYSFLDPVNADGRLVVSWYLRPGAIAYLKSCCDFLGKKDAPTSNLLAKGECVICEVALLGGVL